MRTPIDQRQISQRFEEDGYYFPVDAISPAKAMAYRSQLEKLERQTQGQSLGFKTQLNQPHVIFRFADEIVRTPRILDAVEAIIGPNIMVWGTTFFIKEPHTDSYVSWHQDLKYWGLDKDALVSAWLALSPVTEENGCMRFVPGSHKGQMLEHKDTFDEANFLTRGQEADVEIVEEDTVPVPLEPGQLSLHHGRLLHASAPNRSSERRVGLVINYLAPHVRQVVAKKDFAVLVRGEDNYGHFEQVPPPAADMDEKAIAWHRHILGAQGDAMYDGAAQRPT